MQTDMEKLETKWAKSEEMHDRIGTWLGVAGGFVFFVVIAWHILIPIIGLALKDIFG